MIGGSIAAHREAITSRIFDALGELMHTEGYEAISLADVAAKADLARTTMYNYFPDKDALAVAYAEREVDKYVASLTDQLARADNPVDQLRLYIRRQLRYFATHHMPPGRTLQSMLPTTTYQRLVHHVQLLETILAGILGDGEATGYFTPNTAAALPLVAACVNRGGPGAFDDVDLDDEIDATETFVLRALGARLDAEGKAVVVQSK
ncbi:MAG TPA: TetR/AcrR family transcriptional regulator [Ilumatobacteraceae bacterium]|nr:TetR/AcrR family transcriptional regulator [Ilumatobacteraceae bacterium]